MLEKEIKDNIKKEILSKVNSVLKENKKTFRIKS